MSGTFAKVSTLLARVGGAVVSPDAPGEFQRLRSGRFDGSERKHYVRD